MIKEQKAEIKREGGREREKKKKEGRGGKGEERKDKKQRKKGRKKEGKEKRQKNKSMSRYIVVQSNCYGLNVSPEKFRCYQHHVIKRWVFQM